MERCYICYNHFINNQCNCSKCILFNDSSVNVTNDIIIHNNRKEKYNFKCSICHKELCRECYYKISQHQNRIIKCPYCRQLGSKEYFKQNVVRDVNTLGFGHFSIKQSQKLEKLKKYSDTWKIGYWNERGFPLIRKIIKD